jgi:D-glycero-D-manno-heptose 1,7-bisphosphate phosphatase
MDRSSIAVFLDRDGTVNVDVDYLTSAAQLQLIPRSAAAIKELNTLGVKVFIITNQSGIARGFLTEEDLREIHNTLSSLLKNEEAFVDDYFYCPHLPDADIPRYRTECECRKPKPGMLLQAKEKYAIDLKFSFVIGDRCKDIQCGRAMGTGTVMVETGYGLMEKKDCIAQPDYIASDLYDGVQFIKRIILSRDSSRV